MNDVLAEDALAEGGAVATQDPPPDGAGLQGYNPSDGDEPLEAQDGSEVKADGPEEEEEIFPANPDEVPAGPGPDEEEHEPSVEEEPEPEVPAPKPKSKSRVYLVFEEHGREKKSYAQVPECLYTGAEQIKLKDANADVADYEVPTGELVSRNGDNALRAAYRRLAKARDDEDLRAILVIVAQSSWRPKPIKPRQRNLPPAIDIG